MGAGPDLGPEFSGPYDETLVRYAYRLRYDRISPAVNCVALLTYYFVFVAGNWPRAPDGPDENCDG